MSRRDKREKPAALDQLIGLVVLIGTCVAIGAWQASRPANAVELRIPIAELHSQAAELVLLRCGARPETLGKTFVGWHAYQLAQDIRTSVHQLSGLHPSPSLVATQSSALEAGDALLRATDAVHARAQVPLGDCERIRDRLSTLEHELPQ
jgi:hypothetical protein